MKPNQAYLGEPQVWHYKTLSNIYIISYSECKKSLAYDRLICFTSYTEDETGNKQEKQKERDRKEIYRMIETKRGRERDKGRK